MAEPKQSMVDVAAIKVARTRHRKDMGDLQALADNIAELGMLQPILVTEDFRLVFGERRLRAAKLLGQKRIRTEIARGWEDIAGYLRRAEHAENTFHKPFTLEEAIPAGLEVAKIAEKMAKDKQATAGQVGGKKAGRGRPINRGGTKKTTPKPKRDTSARTDHKAAKAAGMSATKFRQAQAVMDAAAEDPENYGDLLEEMNRTQRPAGAYNKCKKRKQAEEISQEPPPLPAGPFRVIVADPPWRYDAREADTSHRGKNPYTDMATADIEAYLPDGIAHKDSILWLWTTNAHMREAFGVVDAWGFKPKTILTWVKDKMGMGDWLRGKTEHCIMAVRGKPTVLLTNQTTALQGKRTEHSKKPDEFYALVDALCPGSKLELFSRTKRKGWHTHGLEA